jgi:hypothetical protein
VPSSLAPIMPILRAANKIEEEKPRSPDRRCRDPDWRRGHLANRAATEAGEDTGGGSEGGG